jgi:hypothetical protein
MGNEAMPSQLPEGTTWHAPSVQVERHGDTITVAIDGDWAVTVVMQEGSPRWRTFSQERAEDDPGGRTVLQLQPRRGGP